MKIFLAPGETRSVGSTFTFLHCKYANGPFEVKFKDGQALPFGINCSYRRPDFVNGLYLQNPNDYELELDLLFVNGEYKDNSTVISEDVRVIDKPYSLVSIEELTIPDTGILTIDPTGARLTRLQNTSSNELRLYSATGYKFPPMADEELTLNAPFTVHGLAGSTLTWGVFK